MYDFMLTPDERSLRDEVKKFVREEITSDFLRKMDKDEIVYPRKEFVEKLAALNLRGIRFPKKWGGREMSWVAEVAATEEIGCLGMALGCAFVMPSIVGEALNHFGTDAQKEKYLAESLQSPFLKQCFLQIQKIQPLFQQHAGGKQEDFSEFLVYQNFFLFC